MHNCFEGRAPKAVDSYTPSGDGDVSESLASPSIAPMEPPQMIAKFMFGLIGTGEYSGLDAYLEIIDKLVTRVVGEETRRSMRFEYPAVLYIKVDGKYTLASLSCQLLNLYYTFSSTHRSIANFMAPVGRENVVRKLITIGIPFTPPDRASGLDLELRIIEAARETIASGGFKKQ